MVGRFTSVDPSKDGLNWYSYCYNNPVTYVDPLGLRPNNQFTQVLKDPGGGKQPKVSIPSRKEVLTVTETTVNSNYWYENNGFTAADAFKILSNETDKAALSSIVKHLDDPKKNDSISLPINSNVSLTTNNGKISYSNKDTGLSINASTSIRIEHSIDNKTKARTQTITHIKDFKIELGDKSFYSHELINTVTIIQHIDKSEQVENGKETKTREIILENFPRIVIYWFYISGKHMPNSKESLDVYW